MVSSPGVYVVKTTPQTDQWLSYDVSILSELPDVGETIDLGVVDDEEMLDVFAGSVAKAIELEPARDGYLTILGREQNSTGQFGFVLLDQDKNVVAMASMDTADSPGEWPHEQRLDYVATAGEAFYLVILGDSSEVDLRICNLVSQTGGAVDVFDTAADDVFSFAVSETFDVVANGVDYHFDDASTFAFNSVTGDDSIEMVDSDGDDMLKVSPTEMTLSGTPIGGSEYSVTANGFAVAHGYARMGGHDVAQFIGSNGSDRVKTYDNLIKMMGERLLHSGEVLRVGGRWICAAGRIGLWWRRRTGRMWCGR